MTQAFSEFHITQDSGAAANNGGWPLGTNGGPIYETSSVTITKPGNHSLLVDGAGTWSNVYAGHWLTVVAGGVSYLVCVYDRTPENALLVDPPIAVTDGTTGTARVGGAWDKLSSAMSLLSGIGAANWPTGANPPKVDIQWADGNTYVESDNTNIASTGTWTYLVPLRISAYDSQPGDIDWRISNKRAKINGSYSGSTGFINLSSWTFAYNLDVYNSLGNVSARGISSNSWTGLYNCIVQLNQISSDWCYNLGGAAYRCEAINGGRGIVVNTYPCIYGCVIKDCRGLGYSGTAGTLINNIIIRCSGFGISLTPQYETSCNICGNMVVSCGGGIRINGTDSRGKVITIQNNVIAHNSGYGIQNSDGSTYAVVAVGNLLHQNTSPNIYGNVFDEGNIVVPNDAVSETCDLLKHPFSTPYDYHLLPPYRDSVGFPSQFSEEGEEWASDSRIGPLIEIPTGGSARAYQAIKNNLRRGGLR